MFQIENKYYFDTEAEIWYVTIKWRKKNVVNAIIRDIKSMPRVQSIGIGSIIEYARIKKKMAIIIGYGFVLILIWFYCRQKCDLSYFYLVYAQPCKLFINLVAYSSYLRYLYRLTLRVDYSINEVYVEVFFLPNRIAIRSRNE